MEGGEGDPEEIMEVLEETEQANSQMEAVIAEPAEAAGNSDLDGSDGVCNLFQFEVQI